MKTYELAAQAKDLVGHASLIEVARAAREWSQTSGVRIPTEWTQDQIDEVLLALIDRMDA